MIESSTAISLLDCTLRDGSYQIQFQFTAEDTFRLVQGLDQAGIPLIEVGHGLGLNAENAGEGEAAASDIEYIEAAVRGSEESEVGVFYIPGLGRPEDIKIAAEAGIDFIRIGQNVTEWKETSEAIEIAADAGLTVCGNLMKSYAVSPETFGDRCADLESWGADVTYIVDSAGGMLPDDVEAYVGQAKSCLEHAAVGFHCHDNLDLAVANTLKAIDAGAEWVDASLQGIGRSAGNTRLETLTTVLEKQGRDVDVDQKALMDLGTKEIVPLLRQPGINPVDITAGFALFHTKFLDSVVSTANDFDIDVRDLIVAVSEENLVNLSQDAIKDTAERLVETDDKSALARRTSYLEHSQSIGYSEGIKHDQSPTSMAQKVDRIARKFGKTGVVSITPAFKPIPRPTPTVLHRSNQAVLGNIQVADNEQAMTVLRAIDGNVDILAFDIEYAEIANSTSKSSYFHFDDRLAIARAIVSFIDQSVDDIFPTISVLGSHPVVSPLLSTIERRGWPLSVHVTARPSHDQNLQSVVTDANVIVSFGDEGESIINEDVIKNVPSKCIILDAGIRSLSKKVIRLAAEEDVKIYRSDTRGGYITEIECSLITKELFETILGTREIEGVRIAAGGVMAEAGDIVVDSIRNPEQIYGVADGRGGLKTTYSTTDIMRINHIRRKVQTIKE